MYFYGVMPMRKILAMFLVAAALGAVGQTPQGLVPEEKPVLAVAPFVDRSGAGLLGVEAGLAEMLEGKLRDAGYPVIPHMALESWLLGQGLKARDAAAWSQAALAMGADFLLLGSLESLRTSKVSLSLGFFTVEGVSASAEVAVTVRDLKTGEELGRLVGEGTGQGEATASFRLFFSISWDVCLRGLRVSKSAYLSGEPVIIGYKDPSPPNTFYVIVRTVSTPGPSWVSPTLSSSATDPCVQWTWDQMFGATPAAPGTYTVELYQMPIIGPIAWASFQILPQAAGWSMELQIGTPEFSGTAWNQALTGALDDLLGQLPPLLAGTSGSS